MATIGFVKENKKVTIQVFGTVFCNRQNCRIDNTFTVDITDLIVQMIPNDQEEGIIHGVEMSMLGYDFCDQII